MITLDLIDPHWIKGVKDDPDDQCAHGYISFLIDDFVILNSEEEWTVSAAALFLLRSVTCNHSEKTSVAESNYLIPCCGFNPFKYEGEFGLLLMGCNNGIDPEIVHENGSVSISFKGTTRSIRQSDWAKAVVSFSNQVAKFYESSSPKTPLEDKHDKEGWQLFWSEFNERKLEASSIAKNT